MKKKKLLPQILTIFKFLNEKKALRAVIFSKKMQTRFALIEHASHYHDECLPIWIKLLNELGYGVDVFLTQANYDKGIFKLLPDNQFDYRIFIISDPSGIKNFQLIEKFWGFRNYQGVVFNSLFPEDIALLTDINFPKNALFVLHNPELDWPNEKFQHFFKQQNSMRQPIVLAEHIAKNIFPPQYQNNWLSPCFLGIIPKSSMPEETTFLSVQGNIAYKRRNYQALIPLAQKAFMKNKKIAIVGNINKEDGPNFEHLTEEVGAKNSFVLNHKQLDYTTYYAKIQASKFLTTLIDDTLLEHYKSKATSTIPLALALNKILIIHKKQAERYGLNLATSIIFTNNFKEAVEEAANSTEANQTIMKENIKNKQQKMLEESRSNIKALIDK